MVVWENLPNIAMNSGSFGESINLMKCEYNTMATFIWERHGK